jgi:DNA-binding response OmpR family regulator
LADPAISLYYLTMAGVLIVEDDNELREMISISLMRRKFTVMEAANGKEAIMHFKPSITDLVVTDLIMPDEDGLKVIMKLREIKPSLKVIAISGGGKAGPGSYLNLAKALGADAIYSKPFSVNDLIDRIENMLNTANPG